MTDERDPDGGAVPGPRDPREIDPSEPLDETDPGPEAGDVAPSGRHCASVAGTPDADATTPARARPDPPARETRRQRRKRTKAAKPRRKAPWWELPALVLVAIGIAVLVKSFVVQPFYIPSASMEKTLHGCTGCHGDRILVNKPIYTVLRDPQAGDVVVFDAPSGWNDGPPSQPPSNVILRTIRGFGQLVGFIPPDGQVLVKRVIATGGQTVKGDAQGHVMVSTKGSVGPYRTLAEPYVYAPTAEAANQVAFGPVTIPKGRLWVMGDHRTDSADSRYHCTPGGPEGTGDDGNCDPTSSTVPVDKVIGKAFVIAWPPSRWTTLGTPSTFESAAAVVGPGLPASAPIATMVPVFLLRRRRSSR
ncbi:MAG: signal peptidase I [Jatrophihabitans sp.]